LRDADGRYSAYIVDLEKSIKSKSDQQEKLRLARREDSKVDKKDLIVAIVIGAVLMTAAWILK
jgi:hypothetical protein